MAVTSVREIWSDRTAAVGRDGVRRYQRQFRVLTDNPLDDALIVTAAVPIVRWQVYVTNYTFDLAARCQDVQARQDQDHPQVWVVTYTFETPTGRQSQGEAPPGESPQSADLKPWQRPPEIIWDFGLFSKPIYQTPEVKANDGTILTPSKVICNSAGDVFSPVPTVDDARTTLVVRKNLAPNAFDPTVPRKFVNTVNQNPFFGMSFGTVKCQRIGAVGTFESGFYFFALTYEFHYREEGWLLRLVDAGYQEIVGGKKVIMRDKAGAAFASPQRLRNGVRIVDPDPPANPPVFSFDTQIFSVYRTQEFADLHLP